MAASTSASSRQDEVSSQKEEQKPPPLVDIKPLLARLWPVGHPQAATADDIASAVSHFFTNRVSPAQAASLLICLHFSGLDRAPDVLAATAAAMLRAAAPVDFARLRASLARTATPLSRGAYAGGLVDIVGTGGDAHDTFNISTTASILASALVRVAKHGNRSSTSKSGSADLLRYTAMPRPPMIDRVRPDTLAPLYAATNYAFLYAPVFHPGMRFIAPVRKQLPWRTIFNLVGPLSNPCGPLIEARLVGCARADLVPVFADALRKGGARKALVVCGLEDLDEISCAGPTRCCWLRPEPQAQGAGARASASAGTDADADADAERVCCMTSFELSPADFGLPSHKLEEVSPGKEPEENAKILAKILRNQLPDDDPILHFVLMSTAALFVVSGVCEEERSDMGHGDDGVVIRERGPGQGRWKEGVRRARWAIKSGEAARQWAGFVEVTNGFGN